MKKAPLTFFGKWNNSKEVGVETKGSINTQEEGW
jgi:hypothetical protein